MTPTVGVLLLCSPGRGAISDESAGLQYRLRPAKGVTERMSPFSLTGKRALLGRWHRLLLGACLLHAAGIVESQSISDRSIADAIEAQVDSITQPGAAHIRGLSIAWPQLIHQFYAQRNFRPAWDRPGVVNDLHRALRDSRDD